LAKYRPTPVPVVCLFLQRPPPFSYHDAPVNSHRGEHFCCFGKAVANLPQPARNGIG
jgi:hypothetical protein